MNESAPSRSRSALDAVYTALAPDADRPLADLVTDSGVPRNAVRTVLAAAKAGGGADGTNGRWTRHGCNRTTFRDRTVAGFIASAKLPLTFEEIVQALPVSRPQLYTTLARLQVGGRILTHRDGTRTPRYSAASTQHG